MILIIPLWQRGRGGILRANAFCKISPNPSFPKRGKRGKSLPKGGRTFLKKGRKKVNGEVNSG
jgi:hypothetical protein